MSETGGTKLWFSHIRLALSAEQPLRRISECATACGCRITQTKDGAKPSTSTKTRRQNGHSLAVRGSLKPQARGFSAALVRTSSSAATFARTSARASSTKGAKTDASMSTSSWGPMRSQRSANAAIRRSFNARMSLSSQCPLALSDAGVTARLSPNPTPSACKARVTKLVPERCIPTTAMTRWSVGMRGRPSKECGRLLSRRMSCNAEAGGPRLIYSFERSPSNQPIRSNGMLSSRTNMLVRKPLLDQCSTWMALRTQQRERICRAGGTAEQGASPTVGKLPPVSLRRVRLGWPSAKVCVPQTFLAEACLGGIGPRIDQAQDASLEWEKRAVEIQADTLPALGLRPL